MSATLDLLPGDVGARSALYRLQPAGLGTTRVESLTSYFMRLAGAHHLTPGVLLREVFSDSIVGPRTGVRRPLAEMLRGAHAVNGLTGEATVWAEAIEDATERPNLSRLTMLVWADVLPIRHVIRDRSGYCPRCLAEFSTSGLVYEPLIWSLRLVTVCPVHRASLRTMCGACGATQAALRYHSQPGLCRQCSHWLGGDADGDLASEDHLLLSNAISDLVLGPGERLSPEGIGAIIVAARTELGLTAEQFAAALGISPSKVSEWARGLVRPGLDAVLRMCGLGGWSVRAFLEGRLEASGAPRTLRVSIPAARVATDWGGVRASVRRRLRRPGPPPSMREIALACGVSPRWLSKKLPADLRSEIRLRRSAWLAEQASARLTVAMELIASITNNLLAEGFTASRRQVEARLTGSLSLREPALNEAWRSARPRRVRVSTAPLATSSPSAVDLRT